MTRYQRGHFNLSGVIGSAMFWLAILAVGFAAFTAWAVKNAHGVVDWTVTTIAGVIAIVCGALFCWMAYLLWVA